MQMIMGHISKISLEESFLPAILQEGLAYLRQTDFSKIAAGRQDIRGEAIYALVSDYITEPWTDRRPEAHEEYIDIQYVASGSEIIGWCVWSDDLVITEDCRPERDLLFYREMADESALHFSAGTYAIFFPSDIHRPCCQQGGPQAVRKVVLKIAVSELAGG